VPFAAITTHKCFYRQSPDSDKQESTLLCIHGSGGDSSVWESQLESLGRSLRVLAPDLPGHGKSDGISGETLQAYVEWINRFTEEQHLSGFFLAGFSLGGIVAQSFSRAYPEKVKGLILVSTGMNVGIAPEFIQLVRTDFQKAVKASCDKAYTPAVSKELYQKGYDMLIKNGMEIYCNDIMICDAFDSSSWLSTITAPVLIVCGSQDCITPCSLSRELNRMIPGSRLEIIAAAGHMVMQEKAELFNTAVTAFINKVLST
jgi:pimeloyl-ACP methyl ester carboxylesterase